MKQHKESSTRRPSKGRRGPSGITQMAIKGVDTGQGHTSGRWDRLGHLMRFVGGGSQKASLYHVYQPLFVDPCLSTSFLVVLNAA